MGYHDEEAPGNESDEQVLLRLEGFSSKVHALVVDEPLKSGCGATLVSYGLGMMFGQGADAGYLRELCEDAIRRLVEAQASAVALEKKTFS